MYFGGPLAAFLLLYALSQLVALINSLLLVAKILMPFSELTSSLNPLLSPAPEALALPCSQGAPGRYPGMGSRVGWWRWEMTGCRAPVARVKEQHVPRILAQTL